MLRLHNFSWLKEGIMAASSKPYLPEHFVFLQEQGIKTIINLTEEAYSVDNFTIYHIPIPDFDVPTMDQIKQFWTVSETHSKRNDPLLVHCLAGCGRTGTMLAIWLLLNKEYPTSDEAIQAIRKLRPCSIELLDQEDFIHKLKIT
ncbi:MAG: phosphatase domain-containing protein [Candidatus Kariarchaeaceae archaeon]